MHATHPRRRVARVIRPGLASTTKRRVKRFRPALAVDHRSVALDRKRRSDGPDSNTATVDARAGVAARRVCLQVVNLPRGSNFQLRNCRLWKCNVPRNQGGWQRLSAKSENFTASHVHFKFELNLFGLLFTSRRLCELNVKTCSLQPILTGKYPIQLLSPNML